MDDSIGKRLKKARIAAGFKRPEDYVERMDDMSLHTYKAHEADQRKPKDDALDTYCNSFKIRKEWLLLGSGEMSPEKKETAAHISISDEVRLFLNEFSKLSSGAKNAIKETLMAEWGSRGMSGNGLPKTDPEKSTRIRAQNGD